MWVPERGDEVLTPGVLLEAAEEVGQRVVEVCRRHDRRIEQDAPGGVAHGACGGGGHALKQLEGDRRRHATGVGQEMGPGQIEDVVPGHADVQGAGVLGAQGVLEHGLVIGIGAGLGAEGGERPPVQGGVDTFRGQIGPLDDTDLHRTAAPVAPVAAHAASRTRASSESGR